MTVTNMVAALYAIATPRQIQQIDLLLIMSGLAWICPDCKSMNPVDCDPCDTCGKDSK